MINKQVWVLYKYCESIETRWEMVDQACDR